ncbi:glycosyltransferase [Burkholderia cenocepacia]|uniref:glycosyltransferase n=1 Tax=Burkholderia cenocepacia TaxID=95486 RepID=UPI000F5B2D26|nr:glycosyltransferase [Burkholderia cenocepacia]RQU48245.1 hypothetical protein DF143_37760 [Burkholderia cenocepacia]RQV31429.1 hypothetical protein DF033_37285 [Burkholderia cenocepacia]
MPLYASGGIGERQSSTRNSNEFDEVPPKRLRNENQEKSGAHSSAYIPLRAHCSWEGAAIPDRYFFNILRFQMLNPKYRVTIWTTRPMSVFATLERMLGERDSVYRYAAFHYGNQIAVSNPETLFAQLSPRLWAFFLREKSGVYRNLPAASDIIRLAAIYQKGGLWLDCDVSVNKMLPVLDAGSGFMSHQRGRGFANGVLAGVKGAAEIRTLLNSVEEYYINQPSVWGDKRAKADSEEGGSGPNRYSATMAATGPEMIYRTLGEHGSVPIEYFGHRAVDMPEFRRTMNDQNKLYSCSKEGLLSLGHSDGIDANAEWSDPVPYRRSSV